MQSNPITPASNTGICSGSGLVVLDMILSESGRAPSLLAGGSCGNVLTIRAFLGWQSYPIARLGNDPSADILIRDMKLWKVNTSFLHRDANIRTPIIVERIRSGKGPTHVFEMTCPFCGSMLPRRKPVKISTAEQILDRLKSDVFYFDRVSPSILLMAKSMKRSGALIIFEPPSFQNNEMFYQCMKVADIVKHCHRDSHDLSDFGLEVPIEIETMGDRGLRYRATIFDSNTEWVSMNPFLIRNLVDSAGAGDWCTAGIIHVVGPGALTTRNNFSREKLEFALKFGQCLGALNCQYEGARGLMYQVNKQRLLHTADRMIAGRPFENKINSQSSSISKSMKAAEACLCKAN